MAPLIASSLESKGYRVYVSGIYPEQEVTQHTAISSVQSTQHNDGKWHTLTGQSIPRPTNRGLYIHNGRKVII